MEYKSWGRTGLKLSHISLGTMAFGRWIDEQHSAAIIDAALEGGINLIDTADVYGKGMDNGNLRQTGESEQIIGRALKGKRHDVILATKVKNPVGTGINDKGLSRYHIVRALEKSLQRLQTDYIDIYQVHGFDHETPLDETLRALDDLVREGKIRYIACSNFAAWQLAKAHGLSALHGFSRFEGIQSEYSLITRDIEREIVPFVQSEKVGVMAYSPLGRGILAGKYKQDAPPPPDSRLAAGEKRLELLLNKRSAYDVVEAIRPLATQRGWSLAQYALAFVLSQPAITTAIVGASKLEQLQEALHLVQSGEYRLSEQELHELLLLTDK